MNWSAEIERLGEEHAAASRRIRERVEQIHAESVRNTALMLERGRVVAEDRDEGTPPIRDRPSDDGDFYPPKTWLV